jgi:hypothetical protein
MALEASPSPLPPPAGICGEDSVFADQWDLLSGFIFLYYSLSMHRENSEFGTASICSAPIIIVIEARHATESGRYPAAALSKFGQTVMKT